MLLYRTLLGLKYMNYKIINKEEDMYDIEKLRTTVFDINSFSTYYMDELKNNKLIVLL